MLTTSLLATAVAVAAPLPPRAAHLERRTTTHHRTPAPVFRVCPVDRPHRYFRWDFGSARYAGGYHRHQGDDILAPMGTKIRAPFGGKAVAHSNWAGGLAVYLYGRRGFVYNAHLSRLGHLGRVRAGTVIGFVGNSGDASGGAPHDHFEWHPRGGPAVDPYPFLQQACTGHQRALPRAPRYRFRFILAKLRLEAS